MANKIKLIRPDKSKIDHSRTSSFSEIHNYLFKLCVQVEKVFNDILKERETSEEEFSKLAEEVDALGKTVEEFDERIELLEEKI